MKYIICIKIYTWYQSTGNCRSCVCDWIEFEFVERLSWCYNFFNIKMAFNGFRLEYALEGSSNYIS
jgi:hypothetical protein